MLTAAEALARYAQHLRHQRLCQPGQHAVRLRRAPRSRERLDKASQTDWATRFGRPDDLDWGVTQQAELAYHSGQWEEAQRALDRIDTLTLPTDSAVRGTRGNMRLARGATNDARTDAAAVIDYATQTSNDEILLRQSGASTHAATPPKGTKHRPSPNANDSLNCGTRPAGSHHARSISARSLRRSRPPIATPRSKPQPNSCRKHAAGENHSSRIATEHYGGAATLYEQIGSQPLAADAHLLAAQQATDEGRTADAHQHAEVVLGFAKRTGASLYERRARSVRQGDGVASCPPSVVGRRLRRRIAERLFRP